MRANNLLSNAMGMSLDGVYIHMRAREQGIRTTQYYIDNCPRHQLLNPKFFYTFNIHLNILK